MINLVQTTVGLKMNYLKQFQEYIRGRNYTSILKLWEEYLSCDEIDSQELLLILRALQGSEFADSFGKVVEQAIPLWQGVQDSAQSEALLQAIFDLQTTDSAALAQIAFDFLAQKFGQDPLFGEKIRLVGLRTKELFPKCISRFLLLEHMKKGNFIFHQGGWGVGEIMDVSFLRKELSVEFDFLAEKKNVSFETAFKTLVPLSSDHFLSLRFGNPDFLEKKARENPEEVLQMLLRDLGPKTAAEIKDELCDLVIPAEEWPRWWQNTRGKIKKNIRIESPSGLKEPFRLLANELSHEERLARSLKENLQPKEFMQAVHAFIKDFPDALKNPHVCSILEERLNKLLSFEKIEEAQKLEVYFFMQDLKGDKEKNFSSLIKEIIEKSSSPENLVQNISTLSIKKKALVQIRKLRPEWLDAFLNLLFGASQSPLRDYLLGELLSSDKERVKKKLEELVAAPSRAPEAFIWYFQKIMNGEDLLLGDKEGRKRFFESLLILLSDLEEKSSGNRELIKRIHNILSAERYSIVRQILQDTTLQEAKEFLLLVTKCHSLTDHDIKILHSLAEVVHPSLVKLRKKNDVFTETPLWITQQGLQKLQERIQHLATVETLKNAKDIETARSHGDLRENMEYKAALEKRSQLQGEIKNLSDQLNRARILTTEDISLEKVGIGAIVECRSDRGRVISYTLLSPWEADPQKNILSIESKLAQAMKDLKVGEKFNFQEEDFTILKIDSVL
jgi:transcription elongation factor GreA-like protein/transcription elongation GreA/GreB family factor